MSLIPLSSPKAALALGLVLSGLVGVAPPVEAKPVPCPPGRYILKGKFLVVGPGNPTVDAVIISGKNVATGSGCAVVTGKVKTTKKGTRVRAKFPGCRNVIGKASLNAKISADCQTMTGVFNAKGSQIVKRAFTATLSACGDGIVDPEGGEQCEGDDGGCPGACDVRGPCLCPVVVTSTTILTVTTTTGTAQLPSTTTIQPPTTTTITIPGQKPDLIPTDFTVPATVEAGKQVNVSFTVKNQGTVATTGQWYDYVYFSEDDVYGQSDQYLGYKIHDTSVAVSATYTATNLAVTIPQKPAGTYYLFVVADAYHGLSELDEDNNPKRATIVLTTPDLVPTAYALPNGNTVQAGAQVTTQWTVKNQGTGTAVPTWYDYVYFSEDDVLTQQDQSLTYLARNSQLVVNATYNASTTITIPKRVPGTYYLFLVSDGFGTGSVYEGGADANNAAGPIAITIQSPDLTPTAFALPGGNTVQAGAQVSAQWTVKNQGTGPASPVWYDYVYFSEDNILTQQDQYLTYLAHNSQLAVDATYNASTAITIPQKVPGTYYLFLVSDGFGAGSLYEGGADDNNSAGPIALTVQSADLTPTAFSLPAGGTVQAGAQVAVQWTVKNQGTGPANPTWYDYVYFSEDDVFTQQDQYLTYVSHVSQLASGASYSSGGNVTIPQKPPGTYYLFFVSDGFGGGSVYEGGADANNSAGPIAITIQSPDLTPTAFSLPGGTTFARGVSVTVNYTVKNEGTGPANPSWYDYVYLSSDNVLTQQDTYLSYKAHGSVLAANGTYSDSMTISVSTGLPAGTYYLFLITDSFGVGSVYEGGADNDNSTQPLQVTVQ